MVVPAPGTRTVLASSVVPVLSSKVSTGKAPPKVAKKAATKKGAAARGLAPQRAGLLGGRADLNQRCCGWSHGTQIRLLRATLDGVR